MSKRQCVACGRRRATRGSRCDRCAGDLERDRQARQPYRAAYNTEIYRMNRRIRIAQAGGRCEALDELTQDRCRRPAAETDHVVPLSTARTLAGALALCHWTNLRAVCRRHNPRGGRRGGAY